MEQESSMILVAIKITERLRDQLDSSKNSVQHLFADNNTEFLQEMQIESDDYLAKTIRSGASLEEITNMCSNLKSMLKMICPQFLITDGAIKIYAHPSRQIHRY